jgi:inositol-phosphate phosphatase/L-galactose 1-phosphate phosphatase
LVKEYFHKNAQEKVVHVKSGVDLVTEVDKKSEEVILTFMHRELPHHTFVGEEGIQVGGGDEETSRDPDYVWYIDPIDGTTNFVHSYPFIAISIGLAYKGEPVVGVIYNPVLEDLYEARKGGGAFLNEQPISVSFCLSLNEALVVNNIGSNRSLGFIEKSVGRIQGLLEANMQAIRASGSAAVNFAHVASGVVDAYLEDGFGGPWDVCAGIVLVKEAGGVVTDLETPLEEWGWNPACKKVLATSTSELSDEMKEAIHKSDKKRKKLHRILRKHQSEDAFSTSSSSSDIVHRHRSSSFVREAELEEDAKPLTLRRVAWRSLKLLWKGYSIGSVILTSIIFGASLLGFIQPMPKGGMNF